MDTPSLEDGVYGVRILADSLSPAGKRLTTFELTYPRIVHAEFMTHRVFSRNAASSRAIPVDKLIKRVQERPVKPVYWGKNQKGMQADQELSDEQKKLAEDVWMAARDAAIVFATELREIGVHKQIANRLIEPWMAITVICSGTEYGNFFSLRCHPAAQPEIRKLADMMLELYYSFRPRLVVAGGWHLPLIQDDEWGLDLETLKKISTARCARVSYLTHAGTRDISEDIRLHDDLLRDGHMSPFEHAAEALIEPTWVGNFQGWKQYRKEIPDENRPEFDFAKYKSS